MKPIGPIIKKYIEERGMKKGDIAKSVGITYNYLSTIFQKDSVDATMLEKLCVATGLHPMTFFETGDRGETAHYSDIHARTQIGNASVSIGDRALERILEEKDKLIAEKNRLIEEKERTIQILLAATSLRPGTESGQKP